jgi:hypothetical protein
VTRRPQCRRWLAQTRLGRTIRHEAFARFASGEPARTILKIEKRHQPIRLGPRESFVEPLDRGAGTSDHHVMLGAQDAGRFGRRNNVAGIAARDPQDGAGAIGRDPEGGRGILRIARDAKPAVAIPANGGNIALPAATRR